MFNFKKAAGLLLGVSFSLMVPLTAYAGTYTVVSGDTLYELGKLFDTTAETIKRSTNLSGNMIYPGQQLNIPSEVYTVKSGDSLYLVAARYNVPLYALRKVNNKWDNEIFPGQKLNIPGNSASSSMLSGNSSSSTVVQYGEADVDLLARLVTSEAESEPYEAKVGVAAVVLNRIQDSRFPDTIRSVIYQKSDGYYQFTPVENGWINKPATADAKKAALEALNGRDPSNNAVFYFDDSTTNRWLWSKPITARIGRMVFVY